jgi:Tfp pilus assembly protein PilX
MRTFKRLQDDSGSALVAGIIILFIILGLGLAALSQADVQSHQTGHEASGEAAFNMAEGALDAEADLLEQSWPSASTSTCNQSSTAGTFCPGTTLTNSFATTYAGKWFNNPTWSVKILDNSSPETSNYYVDTGTSSVPSYDANADNKLWIRAQANISGQQRIVVAEMVRQSATVSLPHNTITAGGTYTSNQGNKVIIESKDPFSTLSGPIAIRCGTSSYTPTYGDACAGWDPGKGQLDPSSNFQAGYTDPGGGYSILSSAVLDELKTTAEAQGTYYNGTCPTSLNGIVYIDNMGTSGCTYNGGTWPTGTVIGSNGPTSGSPGAIIMPSGYLYFNGNINYYGIVYLANQQGAIPSSGECTSTQFADENEPVFEVHGTAQLWGSVFVDRCGQVDGGSSKANVNFISGAFSGLTAYSVPMLAKNTFRIISN